MEGSEKESIFKPQDNIHSSPYMAEGLSFKLSNNLRDFCGFSRLCNTAFSNTKCSRPWSSNLEPLNCGVSDFLLLGVGASVVEDNDPLLANSSSEESLLTLHKLF